MLKTINRKYKISGMTCSSCNALVENSLNLLDQVIRSNADVRLGELTLSLNKSVSLKLLQNAIPEKYIINEEISSPKRLSKIHSDSTNSDSKLKKLKPLFLILFYITSTSVLINYQNWSLNKFMLDFMGLFFIIFSFFKMLDLRGFPDSFKMYDPLAKVIPIYGFLYPFIETVLGVMFLMRIQIIFTLMVSLIILVITTIGVTKTLLSKKSIQCACLGTHLKLPMTEATLLENTMMIFMSIFMLFNYSTI